MRIVSLLPSATEIVAELGLQECLVGVSHCCDYPEGVQDLPVVTASVVDKMEPSQKIDATVRDHLAQSASLYSLDGALLEELKPDLVITQALCDVCAVSGEEVGTVLASLTRPPQVINLEPFSLDDVLATLTAVGCATGRETIASERNQVLRARTSMVKERTLARVSLPRPMVLLDWIDPPFLSGHWMKDLIELAGGVSVIDIDDVPSRCVSWEDIEAAAPQIIVIACCGFNADRTRREIDESPAGIALEALVKRTGAEVQILDGDALFSRPGPRLVESLELLAHVLHRDIHPAHDWFGSFLETPAEPYSSLSKTRIVC